MIEQAVETKYRTAPMGFGPGQWETFLRDGIIFIEDALSQDDIDAYLRAIERVTDGADEYRSGEYFYRENIVELDPTLTGLIDHERHVGFSYDVYGELLKLHQAQLFIRTPQETHNNKWHPDGARALPYGVFSARDSVADQDWLLADGLAGGADGQPGRAAGQPPQAVYGGL